MTQMAMGTTSVTLVIDDDEHMRLWAKRALVESFAQVLCSGSQIDSATLPVFIDAFVRKGDDPSELLAVLLE